MFERPVKPDARLSRLTPRPDQVEFAEPRFKAEAGPDPGCVAFKADGVEEGP